MVVNRIYSTDIAACRLDGAVFHQMTVPPQDWEGESWPTTATIKKVTVAVVTKPFVVRCGNKVHHTSTTKRLVQDDNGRVFELCHYDRGSELSRCDWDFPEIPPDYKVPYGWWCHNVISGHMEFIPYA